MKKILTVLAGVLLAGELAASTNRLDQISSTGIATPATNDPVELKLRQIMAEDDAAQAEVDTWIVNNRAFAEKGAGSPPALLKRRIEKRFEPVRAAYENFVRENPSHSRGRAAYASFLGDMGDEDAASVELEKALAYDTNSPAVYNNLANIYAHNGQVRKAFDYYARAIELNPRESVYYHNFGTTVYLFRKDAREHFNLGEQQVFDKAFCLYSNAMRLDPSNFPLASDVAQTYYGIKPFRANEALQAWTNALELAHDNIEREGVYVHLARIKLLDGHPAEARSQLQAVTNEMYATLKARILKTINSGTNTTAAATNTLSQATNSPTLKPDAP